MSKSPVESQRAVALLDQLIHEYLQQVDEGQAPDRAAMLARHPELATELAAFFEDQDRIARFAERLRFEETVGLAQPGDAPIDAEGPAGGLPRSVRYFGRYEILEEIARGGMGIVYKARQSRLDRIVALKMILSGQLASSADVARFYSEAQAAANLEHSGIVPIYEVGHYGGQHYFSMAYIEGESLAARLARGPLPEREAARLVQQLCQAVEYAHQRGVIHRDIKPANVLIDADGRPRITDFGLAKQAGGDNGLTATGQVLGTPSFMPPEQASGNLAGVGKAADIYALGAVLYAAVTGRPPFQAPSPVETLLQVRELDPPPPRVLNPTVSRDIETICLKCLEKEPQRRYGSAAEMAEDLRRLLADEPILARRQSPVTHAMRWLRKRRAAVLLVLATTAAAVVLVIGGWEFSRSREQSRLGKLQLRTNRQTLVAEMLDAKDQPAAPNFPVPNSQPVEVPQGNYQVRLSSPGMVSETYLVDIGAREFASADVWLENRYLWPPLEMKEQDFVEPIAVPSQAASLLWRRRAGADSLRLLGGGKGDSLWHDDLQLDRSNLPAGEDLNQWTNNLPQGPGAVTVASELDPPLLIIASRQRPTLIAVSSKTGKVVWAHRGRPKLPDGSPDFSKLKQSRFEPSPVIGKPLFAVGPDKTPIVVYTYLAVGDVYQTEKGRFIEAGPQQIWLEALDAKTGDSLWRYALPAAARNYDFWEREQVAREAIQEPQLVIVSGRPVVFSVHGSKLTGVELTTGKDAWPVHDLGFEPDMPPKTVTDGAHPKAPLAIFVTGRPRSSGSWPGTTLKNTLIGLSLADLTRRWQTTITEPGPSSWPHPSPDDLPQFELAELSDGKPMILSPTWQQNPSSQSNEGATSLTLIDPQTGAIQWERALLWSEPFRPTYFQWIVGPDLDGDGNREVFAAWTGNNHGTTTLIVAALSGRDGHTLWRWTRPNVVEDQHSPHPLCLWDTAADGRPKLVVPIGGASGQRCSYVLDSGDGRLLETLPEVADPRSADLSGDGLPDLYYTVSPQGFTRLMTLRGAPPTAWRRLDNGSMYPVEDLDGDGIADAVIARGADYAAISGQTGRVLWQSSTIGNSLGPPAPMPHLASGRPDDSQATVDVLVSAHSRAGDGIVLQRLDGHTGRSVWPDRTPSGELLSHKIPSSNWYQSTGDHAMQYPAVGSCFLKPDQPAVWAATASPNDNSRAWLHVVSGSDGSIKWNAPIAFGCFGTPGEVYRDFQDLDGDGVADVVAWRPADNPSNGLQLVAYSGADGKPLWPDAPPVTLAALQDNFFQMPLVADLDGQGEHDIVFTRQTPSQSPLPTGGFPMQMEVVVVSGKTGQVKWTWRWLSAIGSPQAPLLTVALNGAGPRFIALYLTEYQAAANKVAYQPMIVLLDHTGKPVLKKTDFKVSFGGMATPRPITDWWRKADLRGDGHEQLTFLDDSSLVVLGGEKLEPLWHWPLSTSDSLLLDVLPAARGKPATAVVWSGTSVLGVSGATGQARWRGEIASPPSQNAPPVLLPTSAGLPRLLAGNACRLTFPTSDSGAYAPTTGEPRAYDSVADPVWLRPLPWGDGDWPVFLAAAVGTLVWLVVPVLLIRWALRRNSWQLAFIPALYQLAMAAVANLIPPDALWPLFSLGSYNSNADRVEFDLRIGVALVSAGMLLVNAVWRLRRRLWVMYDATAIYAIAIAVAWPKTDAAGVFARHVHDFFALFLCGGVVLAAVWLPVQWLARRQYWRLTAFIAASLIIAGAATAIRLLNDPNGPQDQPYSWEGWYWIIPHGFYWTAGLVLLVRAGRRPMNWLWRKASGYIRRRARTPAGGGFKAVEPAQNPSGDP